MDITKEAINAWKSLVKFIEEQGYWRLTKVILFVGFSVCFLYTMKNIGDTISADVIFKQKTVVTDAINEIDNFKSVEHAEQMELRRDIRPKVSELLRHTILTVDADRAFVLELHNGSQNTAGLPFIHCSMTYEEDASDIEAIDEDYQNITLSRFNFPEYLHKNDFWYGTVDEFEKIDKKIADRMRSSGANYLVITTIRTKYNELGYYGITFCNGKTPKSTKQLMAHLLITVQDLSKLLDNTINTNEGVEDET